MVYTPANLANLKSFLLSEHVHTYLILHLICDRLLDTSDEVKLDDETKNIINGYINMVDKKFPELVGNVILSNLGITRYDYTNKLFNLYNNKIPKHSEKYMIELSYQNWLDMTKNINIPKLIKSEVIDTDIISKILTDRLKNYQTLDDYTINMYNAYINLVDKKFPKLVDNVIESSLKLNRTTYSDKVTNIYLDKVVDTLTKADFPEKSIDLAKIEQSRKNMEESIKKAEQAAKLAEESKMKQIILEEQAAKLAEESKMKQKRLEEQAAKQREEEQKRLEEEQKKFNEIEIAKIKLQAEENRKIAAEKIRLEREAAEENRKIAAEKIRLEKEAADKYAKEVEAAEKAKEVEAEKLKLDTELANKHIEKDKFLQGQKYYQNLLDEFENNNIQLINSKFSDWINQTQNETDSVKRLSNIKTLKEHYNAFPFSGMNDNIKNIKTNKHQFEKFNINYQDAIDRVGNAYDQIKLRIDNLSKNEEFNQEQLYQELMTNVKNNIYTLMNLIKIKEEDANFIEKYNNFKKEFKNDDRYVQDSVKKITNMNMDAFNKMYENYLFNRYNFDKLVDKMINKQVDEMTMINKFGNEIRQNMNTNLERLVLLYNNRDMNYKVDKVDHWIPDDYNDLKKLLSITDQTIDVYMTKYKNADKNILEEINKYNKSKNEIIQKMDTFINIYINLFNNVQALAKLYNSSNQSISDIENALLEANKINITLNDIKNLDILDRQKEILSDLLDNINYYKEELNKLKLSPQIKYDFDNTIIHCGENKGCLFEQSGSYPIVHPNNLQNIDRSLYQIDPMTLDEIENRNQYQIKRNIGYYNVPKDGDCQFHSLFATNQTNLTNRGITNQDQLRRAIIDYADEQHRLGNTRDLIFNMGRKDVTFEEWSETMKNPTVFGDDTTLKFYSDMMKLTIVVQVINSNGPEYQIVYNMQYHKNGITILQLILDQVHYNYVCCKK